MSQNDKIQLFENKRIRTAWDEEKEEWYFSVVDVVAVLTDQPDARHASTYWAVLKKRLNNEGADQLLTNCKQLKMTASDGRKRLTDVADTEQLLRIIQSIPSPKAEPFKLWLAQVGRERIEETIDPELTIDRALETYLKKGYSREWINQRLQAIQVRKELTDEWDARGVQKGIPRVVVGCRDSFAKVDGRGIRKLRDAGVDVTVGVMEDECRWLNRRFFTMQEKGRPYVILKWAETADGYMGAIKNGRPAPVSISNAEAFTMSHKQRTTEDGILVGIGTVVSDNPHLTSRLWTGPSPLRIVIDPHGDIPPESNVLTDGGRTLVISGVSEGVHGEVRYIKADITAGNLAQTAIESAKAVGVSSVIVEGGAHTLSHFIESGLWDEAYIYCSDHVMGEGIESPRLGSGELIEVVHMGDVTLRRFKSRELFNGKYFEKI